MAPDADALLEACCCHCMLPIGNGTPTGPAVRPSRAGVLERAQRKSVSNGGGGMWKKKKLKKKKWNGMGV